jgi:hypothetical protein
MLGTLADVQGIDKTSSVERFVLKENVIFYVVETTWHIIKFRSFA